MIQILLCGCCGKMGRTVAAAIKNTTDCEVVAGVDRVDDLSLGFPVFQSFNEVNMNCDIIVDFSNPALLSDELFFAKEKNIPAVIATTGLSEAQKAQIEAASHTVPLFFSYNMSLGVSLLVELSKTAARVLGTDFDVEIVEAHHNQKLDAPSGTALMIADAVKEVRTNATYEYDRHEKREKRDPDEIGIHSIRGGNIVGEHQVIFAGTDEVVTLSHSARSKAIFAVGAINAARFLLDKPHGIYTMHDLINR